MFSFMGTHESRRDFLRIGGLSLGALSLGTFNHPALASSEGKSPLTGKSVVFLFMQGGPSQFETFDPKPDAPEGVRTVGKTIQTRIPGVHFGETFSRLASLADRLAIVRSFRTNTQHGHIRPIVSAETNGASIGAVYSRIAGTNHPQTGLPTSAALFPGAVDPKGPGPSDRFGRFEVTGTLGAAYAPFIPGGGGTFQENLKLKLAPQRLEDRRSLVQALDQLRRDLDNTTEGTYKYRGQAAAMLLKGVSKAFDLSGETTRTINRYDTSHFHDPNLWGKAKNGPRYAANIQTLGKLLLLSRRLAEAGCGFITINTDFVWDMHADVNNLGIEPGMKTVGAPFDRAVSAFIEDVEARGLSDRILLVCCGEMGRTPKINKNGGRDHWPSLAPLLLYGGGLTRGQVIGQSTKDGGKPATQPFEPKNLLATILQTIIDTGTARVMPGLPRDILQMLANMDSTPGVL